MHFSPKRRSSCCSHCTPVFCINGGPIDYIDEWLHLLTCRVEYYVYLRQWAMGVRYESEVMGVVFLAIGDNSYWIPLVIEYLQNEYFNGRLGVLVK